jgi:hypothetical protein
LELHYTIATGTLEEQPKSDNVQEVEASLQEWKDQGLVRLNEWDAKLGLFLKEAKGVKVLRVHRLLAWTTLSIKQQLVV